jgi:hypothetical protein
VLRCARRETTLQRPPHSPLTSLLISPPSHTPFLVSHPSHCALNESYYCTTSHPCHLRSICYILGRVASFVPSEPYAAILPTPSPAWFAATSAGATNEPNSTGAISSRLENFRGLPNLPPSPSLGGCALTGFHQPRKAPPSTKTSSKKSRVLLSPLDGDRQFSLDDGTTDGQSDTASRSSYARGRTSSHVSSFQTRIGVVVEEIQENHRERR